VDPLTSPAPPAAPDPADRPGYGPAGGAEPVNGFRILEQVAGLPVSTWRYRWQGREVRHLGPMAQDWAATFGLGENDRTIAVVDAAGVCLVSIQALDRLVRELQAEVAELRARLAAVEH
jgi:hypothetical protein